LPGRFATSRWRGGIGSAYSQFAPDQELPDQLLPDQLLPDQELPDQLLPDQLLPDRELVMTAVMAKTPTAFSAESRGRTGPG
jgi:hypothetical protein